MSVQVCVGSGMRASVCLSAVLIQAQRALVDTQRLLPAKTPPSLPGEAATRRQRGSAAPVVGEYS